MGDREGKLRLRLLDMNYRGRKEELNLYKVLITYFRRVRTFTIYISR